MKLVRRYCRITYITLLEGVIYHCELGPKNDSRHTGSQQFGNYDIRMLHLKNEQKKNGNCRIAQKHLLTRCETFILVSFFLFLPSLMKEGVLGLSDRFGTVNERLICSSLLVLSPGCSSVGM